MGTLSDDFIIGLAVLEFIMPMTDFGSAYRAIPDVALAAVAAAVGFDINDPEIQEIMDGFIKML